MGCYYSLDELCSSEFYECLNSGMIKDVEEEKRRLREEAYQECKELLLARYGLKADLRQG